MTNKISFLRFEEGDYGESDSVIFIGDNGYSPDDYPIELLIEKINCAFEEELAKVREAERERCLKIVNDFCQCHDDIVQIEKRIREG